MELKPKALVLLSGGLDSILATKIVLDQGIEVEAVHFVTPFYNCDYNSIIKFSEELGIKIHIINLGQEFLDIVMNPKHGYGSQMNPCIDCRILMFKKAWDLANKINANFLVTGEVLNERPFSQRFEIMMLIERETGLEGKILRPLSAKLLPPTESEKKGWINREKLFAIKGRRRIPQIKLAEKLGIKDYPSPSGGCLLVDPSFTRRLRDHLKHEGKITLKDAFLLTIGRHFRVNSVKIVVGRNKEENEELLSIARDYKIQYLMVKDYKGPITLIIGKIFPEIIEIAAAITVRYSDAPKNTPVNVIYKSLDEEMEIVTVAMKDEDIKRFMI
ncbi:MAG: 7-cyano-7-deazaguanine synthase [Candidatus Methanomethylicia archaeon]|nr:7-cyano-7-deazaguanine synthase [Candidatus Methanomethylicia archaeon]MCX8169186.1 7-cyano-7-deazaguanine synthase [Candidatus Methanomethylicia archaeon]MDW7989032.1 tRNA 4-thiouridine(8) synthase ThiI [Nitrososphaerota archaeon]